MVLRRRRIAFIVTFAMLCGSTMAAGIQETLGSVPDPVRDAFDEALEAAGISEQEIDWGDELEWAPEPNSVELVETRQDEFGVLSTCRVGVGPGDPRGGGYQVGVISTASNAFLQASTNCSQSDVQQVRTYVSVRHFPAGIGNVRVATDNDSGFPVSWSEAAQTVTWWTLGDNTAWYGPPTELRFCFRWGYVDSQGQLHWMHTFATVRSGIGNVSQTDWTSGLGCI